MGMWSKNEEEIVLNHLSENGGTYDLDKLKNLVKRPRFEIKQCIERLQQNSEIVKRKGTSFSVEEQMGIFNSVMDGRKMPKSFEAFKEICDKKLYLIPLVEKLG